MTHLNELYLILNKSLKWNKSHLKCFALIMLVIILKQTSKPLKMIFYNFFRGCSRLAEVLLYENEDKSL